MITYPPVIINQYFAENVEKRLPDQFSDKMKFFPTRPTDPTSVVGPAYKNIVTGPGVPAGLEEGSGDVFVLYDRIFRLRRRIFPHIKSEQIIYYLYQYSSRMDALIESVQVLHDLFDRQDESAQEINSWIGEQVDKNGDMPFLDYSGAVKNFKPVFFHETRVYQLEEARYLISPESGQHIGASKVIINYDYHTRDYK
jgi:hypothetical protein